MADFVGLLKKTIEAQAQVTPRLRQRIYERARATVQRKLEENKAGPGIMALQQAVLQQAIDEVEAYYRALDGDNAGQPSHAEALSAAPASLLEVATADAPVEEKEPEISTSSSEGQASAVEPPVPVAERSAVDFVPFDADAFRRVDSGETKGEGQLLEEDPIAAIAKIGDVLVTSREQKGAVASPPFDDLTAIAGDGAQPVEASPLREESQLRDVGGREAPDGALVSEMPPFVSAERSEDNTPSAEPVAIMQPAEESASTVFAAFVADNEMTVPDQQDRQAPADIVEIVEPNEEPTAEELTGQTSAFLAADAVEAIEQIEEPVVLSSSFLATQSKAPPVELVEEPETAAPALLEPLHAAGVAEQLDGEVGAQSAELVEAVKEFLPESSVLLADEDKAAALEQSAVEPPVEPEDVAAPIAELTTEAQAFLEAHGDMVATRQPKIEPFADLSHGVLPNEISLTQSLALSAVDGDCVVGEQSAVEHSVEPEDGAGPIAELTVEAPAFLEAHSDLVATRQLEGQIFAESIAPESGQVSVVPDGGDDFIFPLPEKEETQDLGAKVPPLPEQPSTVSDDFSADELLASTLLPEGDGPSEFSPPPLFTRPFGWDEKADSDGPREAADVKAWQPAVDLQPASDLEPALGLRSTADLGSISDLGSAPDLREEPSLSRPALAPAPTPPPQTTMGETGGDPMAVGDFNAVSDIFAQVNRSEKRGSAAKRFVVILVVGVVMALCAGAGWFFIAENAAQNGQMLVDERNSALPVEETVESATPTAKMTQRLEPGGRESDPGPALDATQTGGGITQASVSAEVERSAGVVFAEAPNPSLPPIISNGRVEWSLSRTPSEFGGLDELSIVGTVELPDRDMTVRMSIQRNTDATIDAAYLIYFNFVTSENLGGETIDAIRLLFKASELSEGQGLVDAIPVKVRDNFFVLALRGSRRALEYNLALMRQLPFLRLNVIYAGSEPDDAAAVEDMEGIEMETGADGAGGNRAGQNFRIGEFSIAKGAYGDGVFKQAIDDWLVKANWAPAAPLPAADTTPSSVTNTDAQNNDSDVAEQTEQMDDLAPAPTTEMIRRPDSSPESTTNAEQE